MKNLVKKLVLTLIILTIIMYMFNINISNGATTTLAQIVEKFNNCETVKEYAKSDYKYVAKESGNKIILNITAPEIKSTTEFTLDGNILSTKIADDDTLSGLMATTILVDCIGQIHGYKDGDLFETLNAEVIRSYTVDKEGFEIKEQSDKSYEIKIDIDKKIPLADFSNVYVKTTDLEDLKSIIQSEDGGSISGKVGHIIYNAGAYPTGESTIYIAEKDNLTKNTYNSILSILEVAFNSNKVSNYFARNYSGIEEGNKTFEGFKVETNLTTEEVAEAFEAPEDYKVAKVTFEKSVIANMDLSEVTESPVNTENTAEVVQENDVKTEENTKFPKVATFIIMGVVVVFLAFIGMLLLKKKE